MSRSVDEHPPQARGRVLDAACAAGLVTPRQLRAEGWIPGQRCPTGCDVQARRGACNYSADGLRFRCHRCGLGGGWRAWLRARGESAERYVDAPPVKPRRRLNRRWPVADGWAALQATPGRWRDRVADWARDARGWPDDLVRAVVGRGGTPPLDDVAAFCTGRMPAAALPLVERARRIDRHIMIAQRDVTGVVRTVRYRWHRDGPPGDGKQKTLALPQWAAGSSGDWGPSLFGRLDRVVAAVDAQEPVLICEGGPDYLVGAALARLGVVGAALGVASCGELRHLEAVLRGAIGDRPARLRFVPHRGDHQAAGEQAMRALAMRLRRYDVRRVFTPLDPDGRGDLADAAAWVRSVRVLAALVESAR